MPKHEIMMLSTIHNLLQKHALEFYLVVPFNSTKDNLLLMDFTSGNTSLTEEILDSTEAFTDYINQQLGNKYKYGIGGYNEHRTIYARSKHFDGSHEEPRRLHLGIDIWGAAGTPVFAPLGGYVHSFAFNDHYGDYGATIILHHQLEAMSFNTLYGHVSLKDLANLRQGQYISRGAEFAHFGEAKENGCWPPHLHFQVVNDMHQMKGDYPGVCKFSEQQKWLADSPDPDLILKMMEYAEKK